MLVLSNNDSVTSQEVTAHIQKVITYDSAQGTYSTLGLASKATHHTVMSPPGLSSNQLLLLVNLLNM